MAATMAEKTSRRPSNFIIRPTALISLSIALLTLSFAPLSQFYLAWFALAPWLICVAEASSKKSAFFWSWIAGTFFFIANMWWMAAISWPGMLALLIFCGLFWAVAAIVIRAAGFLRNGTSDLPIFPSILGIAIVWTATEWVRGIIFTGLPWLFLGYSQSPIPVVCQIADITGAYGVTFWIVMLNALAALAWLNRRHLRIVLPSAAIVLTVTILSIAYGIFRIQQTPACLSPGPTLAVVQSNYPQSTDGEKGAKINERLGLHMKQTLSALNRRPGKIDMVIWSETMMEALNTTARLEDSRFQDQYDLLSQLTKDNHVALLTGGDYYGDWKDETRSDGIYRIPGDKRNTAYLFDADGSMNDSIGHRYDKIHLVPWGEFIPGKESMPFLYRLSVQLGPKYYTDYIMQPGETLTVFHLRAPDDDGRKDWRFVTPICFEDIDARICSAMFRPDTDGAKRADFIVNLTNDGWFQANENADHLQAASFRSIENRAWTARSVNTGISGFVDSLGRFSDLLSVRHAGTSVRQIMIDRRLTLYTRFGDVFAYLCNVLTIVIIGWSWWKGRRSGRLKETS